MSFHSYAHSILWFTKKLASNSSAGGGSPTSFFNSNYLFFSFAFLTFPFVFRCNMANYILIYKKKQVIRVKKTRGAAAPRTRITWASFIGSEEPSLKLSRSSELQRTNSSGISNCRRSKSAIFVSRNINL